MLGFMAAVIVNKPSLPCPKYACAVLLVRVLRCLVCRGGLVSANINTKTGAPLATYQIVNRELPACALLRTGRGF